MKTYNVLQYVILELKHTSMSDISIGISIVILALFIITFLELVLKITMVGLFIFAWAKGVYPDS